MQYHGNDNSKTTVVEMMDSIALVRYGIIEDRGELNESREIYQKTSELNRAKAYIN